MAINGNVAWIGQKFIPEVVGTGESNIGRLFRWHIDASVIVEQLCSMIGDMKRYLYLSLDGGGERWTENLHIGKN